MKPNAARPFLDYQRLWIPGSATRIRDDVDRCRPVCRIDRRDPSTWIRTVPMRYTPPAGPRFNNPYAGRELPGRVVATFLRGEATVLDGKATK